MLNLAEFTNNLLRRAADDARLTTEKRFLIALSSAADACADRAAEIRAALPEPDGAPDAPPARTPDGLSEADAWEWAEDARLLRAAARGRVT